MNILMTSTSYPAGPEDWRGRFIADLAAGLARRQEVALSLWAPPGDMPSTVRDAASPEDRAWLSELSRRGGIAHVMRHHPLSSARTIAGLLSRLRSVYRAGAADVVHVNWLQNALPLWGTRTPAIISVLGTDFGLLRLPGMIHLLRAVFRQRRTILAPNAEWMAPRLEQAFGDLAEVHPVPFGVDEAWFAMARQLPDDGPRQWLAVTRLTRDKAGDLFEWGEGLFEEDRILHLFGPMQENLTLPDWIHYHGPTHPADLLGNWFPRAHGLITLSRHDEGRPQVILEAMASALPVIASDLPAHRNLIDSGRTGRLVRSRSDLAEALSDLEQRAENHAIGREARAWARSAVGNWDDCAARYAMLYRKLTEPRP